MSDLTDLRAARAIISRTRATPSRKRALAAIDRAIVRAVLASLSPHERCHEACPGWIVSHVDREPGIEIEVCDDCANARERRKLGARLYDEDVARLPEARRALREARRALREARA